jgi:transcriptional regulator with XRE-family HTH domain
VNPWPSRHSDGPDHLAADPARVESPPDVEEPGRIAQLVAAHRRRRGLRQCELATAIGWSERSVRRLERGEIEWIRAIERGAAPGVEELRVLRALATELAFDLESLLRPTDVIAPRALSGPPVVPEVVVSPQSEPSPSPVAVVASARSSPAFAVRPHRRTQQAHNLRLASVGVSAAAVLCTAGVASAMTGVLILRTVGAPHITARVTTTPSPARPHHAVLPPSPTVVIPETPRSAAPAPPAPPPVLSAVLPPPSAPAAPAPARLAAATVIAPAARPQRPAGPVATLSATLVDFGAVRAGSSVSRTVTLTNTGSSPLHIGLPMVLMGTDLDTTTDCTGRTLAPGQHCSITETFAPGGPVKLNATVVLTDDTPQGREEFDVRGTSP